MAVQSTHEDGKTEACVLQISNKSGRRVKALWVGFDAKENCYMEVEPGHRRPQQTYTTHAWRIRYSDTGALVGEYVGPSAVLEVQPEGSLRVSAWSGAAPPPKPEWGQYCKRGDALGIEIWSFECVDLRAVRQAEHILRRMLERSPGELVGRLVAGGARVAIIGRNQVTTDIPEHNFLKWSEGGRDTDSTTRGLGGTRESPTTSCGEENLLMEEDRHYPMENILVHEFGHAVMNIGLTAQDREAVKKLYDKAYNSGLYDKEAYIMENEDEYWAEGTQAWFDATIRTDATSGLNTREKLRMRDPGLAGLMARAYGDGPWRYPQDSPAPFRHRAAPQSRPANATDPDEAADDAAAATASAAVAGTAAAAAAAAGSAAVAGAGAGDAAALSAPGVEESMERARLVAWGPSGRGPGWLAAVPLPGLSCCLPGARRGGRTAGGVGSIESSGGIFPAVSSHPAGVCGALGRVASGPGTAVSPGCGAALWSAVRGAVRSHTPHSTVKMS